MAQYNGYKNWNQWNVSLWINNDEWLYNAAVIACKTNTKEKAADILTNLWGGAKTPDGAIFNKTSIRAALVGI